MPQGRKRRSSGTTCSRKDGRPSPDGDRPNLLVGGFPDSGPGSIDLYEIYGNLLVDNPREALFQGSGRISFHDNVLIGGEPAAAVFRDHDLPLRLAEVFDNKIYSPHIGISFDKPGAPGHSVFGNVIYAEIPVWGLDDAYPIGRGSALRVRARPLRVSELDEAGRSGPALRPIDG